MGSPREAVHSPLWRSPKVPWVWAWAPCSGFLWRSHSVIVLRLLSKSRGERYDGFEMYHLAVMS